MRCRNLRMSTDTSLCTADALRADFAHARVTRGIPDLDTVERPADDDARVEAEAGVLTKFLVNVDATLGVDDDFHRVRCEGTLFGAIHLAATDLVKRITGDEFESLRSEHVDAFVLAEREVTARFEARAERRRERNASLGIELSLVHPDKHRLCPPPLRAPKNPW